VILACNTTKDEITRDPYKQACIPLPHMTDDNTSRITSFAISVMIYAERGKVLQPNARYSMHQLVTQIPGITATAVAYFND